jgi:hypothetical protein
LISGAPAFIDCRQDMRGSVRVHDRRPLRTSIGVVGSPNFSTTVATKAAASLESQPQWRWQCPHSSSFACGPFPGAVTKIVWPHLHVRPVVTL